MNNAFIDQEPLFREFLSGISEQGLSAGGTLRCAIDTEADSYHSYKEKLCLVQFHALDQNVIFDPLAIEDLSPMLDLLESSEVWLHGMDFDLSLFNRTFNRVPERTLDTQVAAQLLGYERFGLANLIEDVFEVKLSKESQRADWGKRPLTEKMQDYALNDVRYLLELADHLLAKLDEKGRREWFYQSCQRLRENAINRPGRDPEEAWKIKGYGKLKPRGWAYLRELWKWREGEAEKLDRPPFKVLGNNLLLQHAARLQGGDSSVLQGRYRANQKEGFARAVALGKELPDSELPKKTKALRRDKPKDLDDRVKALMKPRNTVAHDLGIEPSLIANRADLEGLILTPEETWEQLMPWQKEVLESSGIK